MRSQFLLLPKMFLKTLKDTFFLGGGVYIISISSLYDLLMVLHFRVLVLYKVFLKFLYIFEPVYLLGHFVCKRLDATLHDPNIPDNGHVLITHSRPTSI